MSQNPLPAAARESQLKLGALERLCCLLGCGSPESSSLGMHSRSQGWQEPTWAPCPVPPSPALLMWAEVKPLRVLRPPASE